MLLLRVCLLWGLVSLHVVGGAVLFRRLFPRESPWFGFIVPALAFAVLLNFIEHLVAIPTLVWLLPFTSLGSIWLITSPRTRWRLLRLPAFIFLGSFAFTFFLRTLKPDIPPIRDGIVDLGLIANFCMGQALPVDSIWLPGVKLIYYYAFEHYAASVLIRLFGLDVGTGYNVCAALLSAFIYFCSAAVAWRIGRHKPWITILAPVLVACATTGITPYLWFALQNIEPEDVANVFNRQDDDGVHLSLLHYLTPVDLYNRRELFVPGYWSWVGCYHSATVGQFLTLFSVFSMAEVFARKKSNWPWICLPGSVVLMIVCATWGVPLTGLFFLGTMAWCWCKGIGPRNWRLVWLGFGGLLIGLTPMLLYYLATTMPGHGPVQPNEHTQWTEFVVLWWPVYVPALAVLFIWKQLQPATRIVLVAAPVIFLGMEFYTVGARSDMSGKVWGFIFGAAWSVLVPTLATARPAALFRSLLAVLVGASAISLCHWTTYTWRTTDREAIGELEGRGALRGDGKKARLLEALTPLKHQIILTGKSHWAFNESAMLAILTSNSDYVTWSFDCDVDIYRNGLGEAGRREIDMNRFYDGQSDDAFLYLRQRNIAAVVIWPDDEISDDVLAKLKQQLAAGYQYVDLRDGDPPVPPNAGVFLYRDFLPRDTLSTTGR